MSKEVIDHHDGHGLTEGIHVIAEDEVGPGGAHHFYRFIVGDPGEKSIEVGHLQFQKGPRNDADSTPGVLTVAVLAALIDIGRDFQNGPFPSYEGGMALAKMQEAMFWLRARADERARRNVLGHNAK